MKHRDLNVPVILEIFKCIILLIKYEEMPIIILKPKGDEENQQICSMVAD